MTLVGRKRQMELKAMLIKSTGSDDEEFDFSLVRRPFVAPAPAKWHEKYGNPERKLLLLFIGHNPSDHAWASGHFYRFIHHSCFLSCLSVIYRIYSLYSNPANWFWRLLREVWWDQGSTF
jgi:hypothetical protein